MVRKEGSGEKKFSDEDLQKSLIENFISLQKVLTNLSVKFDDLSSNISKLLQLFEISAKSFVDKYSSGEIVKTSPADQEFLKKLDSLLDQNKTISKAILLMEDKIRSRGNPQGNPQPVIREEIQPQEMIRSRPLPKY
jgi:hypothetical protein